MPTYGVIDLGSNSIRLVIYEVKDDRRSTYSSKDFKSIINDKVMAGLAAFVEDGVFTPDGVDRAVNVLKSHMKRVRYFGCKRVDVFATAVLRNAANCTEAVAEIERRCGLAVTLLSARDEAHLGFVGARCSTPLERGTLVDIGGGSTELTRVEGGRDSDDVSLGRGSLSSFARFVRKYPARPHRDGRHSLRVLRGNLRRLPSLSPYKASTLYGVGLHALAAAATTPTVPSTASSAVLSASERLSSLRHAEMCYQLCVAGQQERVRAHGRCGTVLAQRVGGVVEHVARLGHRVHRHLLADAVQARGRSGSSSGAARPVGAGNATASPGSPSTRA